MRSEKPVERELDKTGLRIVLVEPQIPQNTGNIARTCVCTGTPLILCGPMPFVITESKVKRAGLDYWKDLDLTILSSSRDLEVLWPNASCWYFSSKADTAFTDVTYGPHDFLVFGSETTGLPEAMRTKNRDRCVRIPMRSDQRCLNLSNAVCAALYEALRQNCYPGLV